MPFNTVVIGTRNRPGSSSEKTDDPDNPDVLIFLISARPRSGEYTIGICFETAKNTKAFECFFAGFQHSL